MIRLSGIHKKQGRSQAEIFRDLSKDSMPLLSKWYAQKRHNIFFDKSR